MEKRIRVFVICPHALVREGLCALIERQADMTVAGSASDTGLAVEPAAALSAAVVVADVEAASRRESIATFIVRCAPCHVLLLTHAVEPRELRTVLRANAQGYLPFDATPGELVNAIRAVYRGELALHASAARALVESEQRETLLTQTESLSEDLTEREHEVLRLLCEGCSNKQIAQNLFISVRTVEGRLNNIYSKLGIHSRAEAIVAATRLGWLRHDP